MGPERVEMRRRGVGRGRLGDDVVVEATVGWLFEGAGGRWGCDWDCDWDWDSSSASFLIEA